MTFFSPAEKKQPAAQNTPQQQASMFIPIMRTLRSDLKDIGSSQYKAETPGSDKASVNPFSPGGGQGAGWKQEIPKNELSNPFSGIPLAEKARPTFSPAQAPVLENGLTSLLPQGGLLTNRPVGRHMPAWMLSVVGGIALVALGVGMWYFFFTVEEPPLESIVPAGFVEKTPGANIDPSPAQAFFALDKPNALSLNTETVSPADIKKILSERADRIKKADIRVPVEFFITDQSNNPLAFSRFAFLLDLGLDTDLLALTQETFSLYAYNDGGQVRFGLALDFKNTEAATALLAEAETDLPYALRALIIEPDISVAKKSVFRSAEYNQSAVRFTNIDGNRNISLDYALKSNRLLLGMSKNTLRILLDTYP